MAERPEDLNLPNSIITKLVKDSLPANVNVSKDARLAISKAASVFVLYSTSCANNFTMQSKRKMIGAQDVFDAMKEMDFEDFITPLQHSLETYRLNQKGKKEQSEKKKKDGLSEKPKVVKSPEGTEIEPEEETEP